MLVIETFSSCNFVRQFFLHQCPKRHFCFLGRFFFSPYTPKVAALYIYGLRIITIFPSNPVPNLPCLVVLSVGPLPSESTRHLSVY